VLIYLVSDKGTVLKSQLGSGTNTTAAASGTASATAIADPNAGNIGGGSAEGNRGDSAIPGSAAGPSSGGTTFSQGGGTSEGSTIRSFARVVALWSGVLGLVVGAMFTLL